MATTRIRTLNFLPEIFKTPSNAQFLRATLDQIVDQPNTRVIQGFVGSKFGYGVDPKDYYVVEPTKTRKDYQLEPGVIFTKANETVAKDFISYPGIIDALKLEGGLTDNNNRLFNSQIYSWDSFTNLDKIINYNQYYWLPNGPQAVIVSQDTVFNEEEYIVTSLPNAYNITDNPSLPGSLNPTLTLLRGGSYTFVVDQNTQFWIQGAPGITGASPVQSNLDTREVLGVENNGASEGVITFNVPFKTAQDEYNLPGNNTVDVVSTLPFSQVNGAKVSTLGGIDGITSLSGLTLMFYNTGVEDGTSNNFYVINLVGLVEDPTISLSLGDPIPTSEKITVQYGTQWVGRNFFKNITGAIEIIPYISAVLDTLYYQDGTTEGKVGIIKLIDSNSINPINVNEILGKKNYTAANGVVFTNGLKVVFQGDVIPESYLQGEYYVEGVGTAIELIPVNDLIAPEAFTQTEFLPYDISPYDIGNYDANLFIPKTPDYITIARNSLSRNAWSRSNRWFHIDVINATATYNNDPALISLYANKQNKAVRPIIEFYPNLKLFNNGTFGKPPIDFMDFRTTDAFEQVAGQTVYYPDITAWTSFPGTAIIEPVAGDINTLGLSTTLVGSRIECVSTAGFKYGDEIVFTDMEISGTPTTQFGLLQSGITYYIADIISSTIFTVSTERFGPVLLQSDVLAGPNTSMTITVTPLSTFITVDTDDITNTPEPGQYIADNTFILPSNAQILTVTGLNTATTTIQVGWDSFVTLSGTNQACLSMSDSNLENFQLFDGARIVFAKDETIKNKIFVSQFSQLVPSGPLVITLFEASDGNILNNDQVVAYRGYYNEGKDFYYKDDWFEAQQKIALNQPPLFDIFDKNGISFGDNEFYSGSSFKGCKLFAYGIGTGIDDPVLNFPLRYSSIDNIGDISFDVSLNIDTFDYVLNNNPITQSVNTGYVYNYFTREEYTRELGWQTTISPSIQYQVFEFTFDPETQQPVFKLDVLPVASSYTNWPIIQVYSNNNILTSDQYTVDTNTETIITVNSGLSPVEQTVVQILIISDQVSSNAYYSVPINLTNNPFNADPTTVNVGDIRGQYQSIFYNNPNAVGQVFGSNNYRDLGNVVPYGNRIIQNSASLVLPGAFLRNQNHNLFNAIEYNSRSYINYKTLLIDVINKTEYSVFQSPAEILDDALDQITASRTDTAPFFWSDMLPSKAPYITNTYSFNINSLTTSVYPLSKVYNFKTANYDSVLVYLVRKVGDLFQQIQLIRNVDYTISQIAPSLTVNITLEVGDQIIINEYNQTYGSYVPNTPTKLGLYPATVPSVILDSNYTVPTYFIRGHDGSYNKLYGSYDPVTGRLTDFRDQALLEFEKRIYNNLKLSAAIPIPETDVIPGFWRETDYTNNEILQIYSELFLNWVGQNRIDFQTQQYNVDNFFSYNYWQSGNKINRQSIEQGNWRGIYQYYFDTTNVSSQPWEMIGYTSKPTWWENRYGPAPYTSDNLVLWNDLAQGIDYNDGVPIVKSQYVRPELLMVLPVNSEGNLLSPFDAIVGNYTGKLFKRNWKVGDSGPAEFAYRRSPTWPFDLMKILALTKPAEFFNLGVDLDNYKYSEEFNQYLVNDRRHLIISDIQVYGSGIAKTSYINWIVDYEKQLGVDATTNITSLLDNLDVRLVYRLAGFSDKDLLKFFVEKSVPSSRNASLLIPDESYAVLLYDNQPFDRIIYSGVVVQKTASGFAVYGNSQTKAYFTTLVPVNNGKNDSVEVENLTVRVPTDFTDKKLLVPYGAEFNTVQEVANFLSGYGAYLVEQGMTFQQVENGLEITWRQMIAEFLYWAQLGWEVGSITTLNPAASNLSIDKDSYIVQPLTIANQNFVLNQNLYPIQSKDLSVIRDETLFAVQPLNEGDTIGYGQFNISNFEHGIVFDNVTLFNDTIYNLITGLKQNRIYVRGSKTAGWNGTVDAAGFILNQDNIVEWSPAAKYTTGSIVTFKNKFYIALRVIQPRETFQESDWKETDYNEIQKGLLPNSSTRSFESTLYYDVNKANLETDADLLSFSLIGFRPRDYMSVADLTDITQVNLYQNIIRNKGTRNAVDAFKGAVLPQGGIDYDVYENWAIKAAEFGGTLSSNFIEFKLLQSSLTGNPALVALNNGVATEGAQQEVPLYSLFNYGRPVTTNEILQTLPPNTPNQVYMDAGYVNLNDVKLSSYFYSGLPNGTNKNGVVVPLSQLYVRDYVWLANYLSSWQILTPLSLGQVLFAKNNLNETVTITFDQPHNLKQFDIFAIVNFNEQVDGYYVVALVVDPNRVIINLNLNPSIRDVVGQGIGLRFQSQRVSKPSDIASLPLLSAEFSNNKVWVDESKNGDWAVYRKTINYNPLVQFTDEVASTYGTAVAYTEQAGHIISDPGLGKLYRYVFNTLTEQFDLRQELTFGTSFGSTIAYQDDLFAVSEPTGTARVHLYKFVVTNELGEVVNRLEPIQILPAQDLSTNWGRSIAISGDKNWIYISAPDLAKVYVYRLSQNTNQYEIIRTGAPSTPVITLSIPGLNPTDNFGYSISTDYYGETVIVGAPNVNFNSGIENWGKTYVFNRIVQSFNVQNANADGTTQTFALPWSPSFPLQNRTITSTSAINNRLQATSITNLTVDMPIIITGPYENSNISPNKIYFIKEIFPLTNQITISSEKGGDVLELGTTSGSTMILWPQITKLFVSVNSVLLSDNEYAYLANNIVITKSLKPGDILTISGQEFKLVQTLTTENTPRVGVQFGYSIDTNSFANEILIGAPFDLDGNNQEGTVYRFTNVGEKYGSITGTTPCLVTTTRPILINGFDVYIPPGGAGTAAAAITSARIPNVLAAANNNGTLTIQLIDNALGTAGSKLSITVIDEDALQELGLVPYVKTQEIKCPHNIGPTQFGKAISFNSNGSFVASAPVGTRFSSTTFDVIVDDTLDNDTIFDNNSTQWLDQAPNAGAVYMFDYLSNYNESLANTGKFVYAQSVNDDSLDYGLQPNYGTALDFNQNVVMVGTPGFKPGTINGKVNVFESVVSTPDWTIYRQSSQVVDINKVENIQIFSAETNNTLDNLDYIDPLQGKLLGVVRENLDYISNADPAGYNVVDDTINQNSTLFWGASQVGKLWFDTSNVRFLNYHQDDNVYNSEVWGKVFAGSDVAVYSWIASNVPPIEYQGPGTVLDIANYSIQYDITASGELAPIYYYWVRNSNIIFVKQGKTLSDSILETYIANPQNSGISYFAPLLPNLYGLYNVGSSINANDSVLHIGFNTGNSNEIAHQQYDLIRANFADDFLPGLPGLVNQVPQGLYDRLLDSMSGVDELGQVVPNPFLPKAVQTGIQVRPRQSFFLFRFGALKNYFQYINSVLAQFPITEIRNPAGTFLNKVGPTNPSDPQILFYNTPEYWEYINWWAPGYDDNTKSAIQVPLYADLATLNVAPNTIVRVSQNNNGSSETYIYTVENNIGSWVRIGLSGGTIRFKSSLWDYKESATGFGDNFFDTVPYDQYPSEETRYILRALNEQILINELLIFRNRGLITLFEYIQNESLESQNYLPWLNKTSFIDVFHTLRQLKPYEVFQSDNQDFLSGYINEVKPYHVVIKEFVFKYSGEELYAGTITDFDLPAEYNSNYGQFITPMLVNSNPNEINEYTADNSIWEQPAYTNWFNNRGISIVGQSNYPISTLASYVTLNSEFIAVDNASGFPVSGIITIGNEKISYGSVDRNLNLLTGIFRGVDSTTISTHLPGTQIYIDLPGVIVLDGGRRYSEPPKVTAFIDTSIYPAPLEPAILSAVMSGDKVLQINIENPGKGYVVTPEIRIDSAVTSTFTSEQVNVDSDTIQIFAPDLATGDLIEYKVATGTTPIGGLQVNQWYYVNVLETTPTYIVGLYSSYDSAIRDQDRIEFYDTGSGNGHSLNLGAKASCITTATPVRENNITLRFDRTTYNSDVIDWEAGRFYSSFFAGSYYNSVLSSSSLSLQSTQPSITDILASKGGIPFEIANIENEQILEWSSLTRNIVSATGNIITLAPFGNSTQDNASGSTIGFYQGMPIYFNGNPGATGLVTDVTYYVDTIIDNTTFTLSDTIIGAGNVGPGGLLGYTGSTTDTAVLTLNYPGILNVTNTLAGTNYLTVPLYPTGSGGTKSLFIGTPIFFTGQTFGGIVENLPYYVTTVVDNQRFTMSTEQNPLYVNLSEIDSVTNNITIDSTVGFSINDPVIVTNITIFAGYFQLGEEYRITELSTTDWNALGYVGAPVVGGTFTATAPGEFINAGSFIVGNPYRIYSLGTTTDWQDIGYVGTPTVGGTFIATGVGSGDGVAADGLGKAVSTDFYPSFGGITSGTTYYVSEIVSTTEIKLSASINGPVLTLTSDDQIIIGSSLITNQKNCVQLTTDSGSEMVVNIALPVSPGQIDGQKFTLYNTSSEYVNKTGTLTDLLSRQVSVTIGNINRLALTDYDNGLNNLYVNMPVQLVTDPDQPTFHGINTGATYYIKELGKIIVTVTQTSQTTNRLLCNSVTSLYIDMPIVFTNESLGLVDLNFTYYVKEIFDLTNEFTISSTPGGTEVTLQDQLSGGIGMLGTGSPYITLSASVNGAVLSIENSQMSANITSGIPAVVTVSDGAFIYEGTPIKFSDISGAGIIAGITYYVRNPNILGTQFNISLTKDGSLVSLASSLTAIVTDASIVETEQYIDPSSEAEFDVSYVLGGYSIIISNAGQGYAVTNEITIEGANIGGETPNNNLIITVTSVDSLGGILDYELTGTPNDIEASYYLKVISPTQLKVYSNSIMTAPVSGLNFSFNPVKTTTVIGTTMGTNINEPVTPDDFGYIIVNDVTGFSINNSVVFTGFIGSSAGLFVGKTYYIADIDAVSKKIQLSTNPGESVSVIITETLSGLNYTMGKEGDFALLPEPFIFNQSIVSYNNRVWICVVSNNDQEFILGKWQELQSDDRRLNALDRVKGYYQPTVNMPGKDLSQLFTGIEYANPQYVGNAFAPDDQYNLDTILQDLPFNQPSVTDYDVVGEQFTAGYGPEELVPGIVSDSMTMTIATRPGTNWPVAEYQNVGYFTKSIEIAPSGAGQTLYSFYDLAQTPQQIRVSAINRNTGLSTTLVGPNEDNIAPQYSVDWINETVTLATPIIYLSPNNCDKLRIDVYEAGNGDQLVRANTNTDAIRINESSGWNEIYVNCNYSADLFSGSGVIRPNTEAIQVEIVVTEGSTNELFCSDVSKLILNEAVTFQGEVFGNVAENTTYYIKTISNVTNSITISDILIPESSIAGPTFTLVDGTGSMVMVAEPGQETPWSDPIVYWNGKKLIFGVSRLCAKTNSLTNTIICNSTWGLVAGQPITFDNNIFGGIQQNKIYYIHSISSLIAFSISETIGGPVFALNDAFGQSYFITNDFTVNRQPNQFSAMLVLPGKPDPEQPNMLIPFEQSQDYITYALFGETTPTQYGGSIPEIQYFVSDGSVGPYNLTNYDSGSNPTNAVVEVDGLRIAPNNYVINSSTDTLTFTLGSEPAANSIISVTTYQFTERQYFNTQTFVNKTVSNITDITTEISPYDAQVNCFSTDGVNETILVSSTASIAVGMTIEFKTNVTNDPPVGNIATNGTVYFVKEILPGNLIKISATQGGLVFGLETATLTNTIAYVGGNPTTRVYTSSNHNLNTNDIIRIDSVQGAVELNNQLFYVHKISDTIVDLYQYLPNVVPPGYNPLLGATNFPVVDASTYTGGGFIWKNNTFVLYTTIATSSSLIDDSITVTSTNELVLDTPIIFVQPGQPAGTATVGGLLTGQTYYIKDILPGNSFTVSSTIGGETIALTDVIGANVFVSQWEQFNVDRLWVTVNGYRLPSSSLKLNLDNELSILTAVEVSDQIVVTSMIPTPTPSEQVYLMNVNKSGVGVVNRANTMTRTWLTEPLYNTSETITVQDATRITDTIVQQATVGTPVNDEFMIGLNGDKDLITQIIVYNNNTLQLIDPQYYRLEIVSTAPQISITVDENSGVSEGDLLTITEVQGNLIYLNGEYIGFTNVDIATGVLSGLVRGLNGTGIQPIILKYSEVYGILSANRMTNINYNDTWNSNIYNVELGDPLQISQTNAANFLNRDIT